MADPVDREKVNDLMARMLTCATFLNTIEISQILTDQQMEAIIDARSLLVQAASTLEQLKAPPEPMEIIEAIPPPPKDFTIDRKPQEWWINPHHAQNVGDLFKRAADVEPYWTDPGVPTLPGNPSPRACPKCNSRAQKIVHRKPEKGIDLECPTCSHVWPWIHEGKWI